MESIPEKLCFLILIAHVPFLVNLWYWFSLFGGGLSRRDANFQAVSASNNNGNLQNLLNIGTFYSHFLCHWDRVFSAWNLVPPLLRHFKFLCMA